MLGLTRAAGPMITVGTVSLPSAIDRTIAASSGCSQMFRRFVAIPASCRPRPRPSTNGQPGRQNTSIASMGPATP